MHTLPRIDRETARRPIRPGRSRWVVALACLILLSGMAGAAPRDTRAAAAPNPDRPLRSAEPLEALVADLEGYIPARMAESGVPGLSIALIRNGELVWRQGFGVAHTLTRQPVTPETAFEVASISKTVAAYTALRLVERGTLSLDQPVSHTLPEPWLSSPQAEAITLRHLLSHTSGLSNDVNPLSKTMLSAPGEDFYYSGVGFVYLQTVMESATGQSLEALARDLVFAPLGMTSSNYVNAKALRPALAYGHCNLGAFLAPVMQVFAAILAVALLAVVAVQRLRRGRWSLSWRMLAVAYVLAVLAGIAIGDLVAGPGARKWTLLTGLWLAGLGIALGSLGVAARQVARRLPRQPQNPARQGGLVALAVGVGAVASLWLSFQLTVPVPHGPAVPPNAAYSLQATAGDLARFLIELSDPQLLPADLADEMRTAQVRVNADNAWGLGLAITHSPQGDALWHGGSNRDFQAHMVVYPGRGWGAVVLTNGERGGPVARDVAARALGGKAQWSLARQP